MPQATPIGPELAKARSETHRLVEDLTHRISRQERRVQKILFNREGPAGEMQAVLTDMIEARDMLQTQLESFEKEARDHDHR